MKAKPQVKQTNQVTLVWASTGEYEDYQEAVVRIFRTARKARQFCDSLEKQLKELGLHSSQEPVSYDYNCARRGQSEALCGLRADSNGIHLGVVGPYKLY